jgi:4-hydroxybenzoate polyprenyltransferase
LARRSARCSAGMARRGSVGARAASALDYWRLLHPLPSLLTVAASAAFAFLAAAGVPPLPNLLLLVAVETCRQFSISAFNDYFDREVDRGRADKPVASGAISPRTAWLVGAGFSAACMALSLLLGIWLFVLLTAVGLGGGLLYDAGLKQTALSWLPFAVAFPTLPLWAYVAVHPAADVPDRLLWVWPVGAVLVVGIHLADTIPDLGTDAEAGVRGLAHRLGLRRSLAVLWGAFVTAIALTLALWPVLRYHTAWYVAGLAVCVVLMAAAALAYKQTKGRVRTMSLLLEVGALALAVGWVGGVLFGG